MAKAYLVLIETGSNQAFIFGSNKLRECVGASELVRQVGMVWVPQALADLFPAQRDILQPLLSLPDKNLTAGHTAQLRSLAGEGGEPNARLSERGFEIVVATSGKAIVLVVDLAKAKDLVTRVTRRALIEAPGLVVRGSISSTAIDLASAGAGDAASITAEVHQLLDDVKLRLPPAIARAPMWPMLRPCDSTGLPASGFVPNREWKGEATPGEVRVVAASAVTLAKENITTAAYKRMKADLGDKTAGSFETFANDVGESGWMAIVHADGNGFGQFFLELSELPEVRQAGARGYFNALRRLSLSLELCGLKAFLGATESWRDDDSAHVVPLVIGGDDLTVACTGGHAISFAARYLEEFEKATMAESLFWQTNDIPILARGANGVGDRLFAACAGVAIVKPHFPFHRAYELSEVLLKSAKSVKQKTAVEGQPTTFVSALDYQIVFDDAAVTLHQARGAWDIRSDGTVVDSVLTARPYVVTNSEDRLNRLDTAAKTWANNRRYSDLERRRSALALKRDENNPDAKVFPRSQQKALRDALFRGSAIAKERFDLMRQLYEAGDGEAGFRWGGPLYFVEKDVKCTQFLDALEFHDVFLGKPGTDASAEQGGQQ